MNLPDKVLEKSLPKQISLSRHASLKGQDRVATWVLDTQGFEHCNKGMCYAPVICNQGPGICPALRGYSYDQTSAKRPAQTWHVNAKLSWPVWTWNQYPCFTKAPLWTVLKSKAVKPHYAPSGMGFPMSGTLPTGRYCIKNNSFSKFDNPENERKSRVYIYVVH